MALTPKRRGRPPLDPEDPSISVHVRLVSKDFDALCARAGRDRETLPQAIRRALAAHLVAKNRIGG